MTLTKLHFQIFAEALSKVENETERDKLIDFLMPIFKQDNMRFSEDRFKEFIRRRLNGEDLKGLNCNPKYLTQ